MKRTFDALIGTRFRTVKLLGFLDLQGIQAVLVRYQSNDRNNYLICDRELGTKIGGVANDPDTALEYAERNAENFLAQRSRLQRFMDGHTLNA